MTSASLSRRGFLTLASVVGVVAAARPSLAVAATGPILKPIPPEWFVPSAPTPRCGGTRWTRGATAPPRSGCSCGTTPRRRPSTPRPTGSDLRRRPRHAPHGDRRRGAVPGRPEAAAAGLLTAVHECTGNGRRFFAAQQGRPATGTQWSLGSVGTVAWDGVWLRDVLAPWGSTRVRSRSRPPGSTTPYVTGGVDYGPGTPPVPGRQGARRRPPRVGRRRRPLLPDHGFPLRLVLPGWVGIASIKWLGSLEVSTSELTSPWNTKWYRMTGGDFPPTRRRSPSTRCARPGSSAGTRPCPRSGPCALTGRSWSGAAPITRVDVSLDGGRLAPGGPGPGRSSAAGVDPAGRSSGARPRPGNHELLARATDAAGRTQPLVAAYNDNGYFFDAVVRHPVRVA